MTADVVTGSYVANSAIPASQRFTPGASSPNAVQVTLHAKADLFFGASILGVSDLDITRSATAATAQMASFSVGSGLASVQGGVANAVLGGLTGSQVNLSVMDYNALAGANVDLLQYSQALQTDMSLQGASFNSVLSSKVSQSESLKVLASLLTTNGQTEAGTAMQAISAASSTVNQANLGNVIDLGPYGSQSNENANSGAGIQVNALQLADAMLEAGQGGHELKLALGSNVPGLTNSNVWLAIGQRPQGSPWVTITDADTVIVRTAQARLYIDGSVSPAGLNGLGVTALDAPVYVELASAEAKLTSLTCPAGSGSGATPELVTLSVNPSVGQIAFGSVDPTKLSNFSAEPTISPATILSVAGLVSATAKTDVNLGGDDWQPLAFTGNDISSDTMKSVSTNNVAQATVASLLANTNVQVNALGFALPLSTSSISSNVTSDLGSAAGSLDSILNTTTGVLGLKLGQGDAWVNGVRCGDAALVA